MYRCVVARSMCPASSWIARAGAPRVILHDLLRQRLPVILTEHAIASQMSMRSNARDQAGRQSVRVNDQYRVTFRWEQGHAYEVRVEDYH